MYLKFSHSFIYKKQIQELYSECFTLNDTWKKYVLNSEILVKEKIIFLISLSSILAQLILKLISVVGITLRLQ